MAEHRRIKPAAFPDTIGPYRLERELGRGAMGMVYLAQQDSLGRQMALKFLSPELSNDRELVERFQREGRIAAALRHPHIVQIFDASEHDGFYFIAMEYLGKRTLRDLMASDSPPTVAEVLKLSDQLLDALQHAHEQGVVHRDIKPANIMVTEKGSAVLTDFSIAKLQESQKLTQTGVMIGTPEYMAPEQFDGRPVDHRADLYALGVVIYEMLTRTRAFKGSTSAEVMTAQLFKYPADPATLNPEVSAPLAAAVMKALEKSPDKRYASAEEMRRCLREGAPGSASTTTLEQFLADVTSGRISLDEANSAREMVKEAIDRGYKRDLTVMILDLAGSSKVKIPDQTLVADRAFRDYRATINEVISRFGCRSYDWSGDGAICIFESAPPAVRAALEIQSLVDDLMARHALPSPVRVRIGINSGKVYLDPRRTLGEFASRTVDQTGHIEKDCPPGHVHVGQTTMELTREFIEFEEVGVNRDDVMVYRALPPGQKPAPPASQPAQPAPEAASPAPVAAPAPLLLKKPEVSVKKPAPAADAAPRDLRTWEDLLSAGLAREAGAAGITRLHQALSACEKDSLRRCLTMWALGVAYHQFEDEMPSQAAFVQAAEVWNQSAYSSFDKLPYQTLEQALRDNGFTREADFFRDRVAERRLGSKVPMPVASPYVASQPTSAPPARQGRSWGPLVAAALGLLAAAAFFLARGHW